MPIDASIPLSYKPVQTPNMLASMAQGQELGINALKMQEAGQTMADRSFMQSLDPTDPQYINKIAQRNPKLAIELQKGRTEARTAELDQRTKIGSLLKTSANSVIASPTLENAVMALQSFAKNIGEDVTSEFNALKKIGDNPEGIKKWAMGHALSGDQILAQTGLNAYQKQSLGQAQSHFEQTQNKPTFSPEYGGYVSPPSKNNPKGSFTPITNVEGTPLQSIRSLSPQETALLTQAIVEGRLDPSKVNSRNQKTLAATLTANPTANLRQLTEDAASGLSSARTIGTQEANVSMAASEARKMITIANDYSAKVDRTEYPNINAISNAVSKGTGDANIVQLNTALNSLVNVYARAINPKGVATVDDKKHARELVNAAYSSGQLSGIFQVMDQEMAAAQVAGKEARKVLRGGATSPAGASSPALPPGFTADN